MHETTDSLPLFDKHTDAKDSSASQHVNSVVSSADIICFRTAAESRKTAAQTSLEKTALESILASARKLNW
jgi:hypothetical protein